MATMMGNLLMPLRRRAVLIAWVATVLALCSCSTTPSRTNSAVVDGFSLPTSNHYNNPPKKAQQQQPPAAASPPQCSASTTSSRRDLLFQYGTAAIVSATTMLVGGPTVAWAKADCFTDCFQNCKKLAPQNLDYCKESCQEYCDQPDRQDGLSGSVSADRGEVGILGGSFGQGTVPKGADKPPTLLQLPGLDFKSESGKKLIGY